MSDLPSPKTPREALNVSDRMHDRYRSLQNRHSSYENLIEQDLKAIINDPSFQELAEIYEAHKNDEDRKAALAEKLKEKDLPFMEAFTRAASDAVSWSIVKESQRESALGILVGVEDAAPYSYGEYAESLQTKRGGDWVRGIINQSARTKEFGTVSSVYRRVIEAVSQHGGYSDVDESVEAAQRLMDETIPLEDAVADIVIDHYREIVQFREDESASLQEKLRDHKAKSSGADEFLNETVAPYVKKNYDILKKAANLDAQLDGYDPDKKSK